jgi:hypothetical protein
MTRISTLRIKISYKPVVRQYQIPQIYLQLLLWPWRFIASPPNLPAESSPVLNCQCSNHDTSRWFFVTNVTSSPKFRIAVYSLTMGVLCRGCKLRVHRRVALFISLFVYG